MSKFHVRMDLTTEFNIMNCLQQFVASQPLPDTFSVIRVWFPQVANRYLQANTPANGFHIYYASEKEYTRPEIVAHAQQIWQAELVPVEILTETGAYFFALPKSDVRAKHLFTCHILPAEDTIPALADFRSLEMFDLMMARQSAN